MRKVNVLRDVITTYSPLQGEHDLTENPGIPEREHALCILAQLSMAREAAFWRVFDSDREGRAEWHDFRRRAAQLDALLKQLWQSSK